MSGKRNERARKSKYATKSGEFRHKDGDRRHRGSITSKQATRDKKVRRAFTEGIPVDDPSPLS
jgi:hypothetical protein